MNFKWTKFVQFLLLIHEMLSLWCTSKLKVLIFGQTWNKKTEMIVQKYNDRSYLFKLTYVKIVNICVSELKIIWAQERTLGFRFKLLL